MAETTATWTLKLKDEMSGAANSAAQALKRLDDQLASDTRELAAMQKAMRNLQSGTTVNVDQFRKLRAAIDAKKQSIAKVQGSIVDLGGKFEGAGRKSRGLESRLRELTQSAKNIPGPIGATAGRLGKLHNVLGGGAIAGGLLAISVAMAAVTVAAVVGTAALYRYGVAQADARRSELLRLEALAQLQGGLRGASGGAMQDAIDEVAAKTPLARAQVVALAEQLRRSGVPAAKFKEALEGAAIKKALPGGDISKQMSSLAVQALKTKESFNALFSGLKIEAYLAGWKSVRDMLSQATASGRALKLLTTTMLQPLIDSAAGGASIVKRFFQGVIIAALDLAIALVMVRSWWRKTFGTPEQKKAVDSSARWVLAGRAALGVLVVGLGLAATAVVGLSLRLTMSLIPALARGLVALMQFSLGGITAAIKGAASFALGLFRLGLSALMAAPALWAAIAPMLPFIAAAVGVGLAIYTLIKYWDELKIAFEQVDWLQMGKDMLQGLISGLQLQPLVDHMVALAGGSIDAFKEALGIASPSKVFTQVGLAIPQGVAAGVRQGSPEAQQATNELIDVPRVPSSGRPGGALPEGAAAPTIGGSSVHVEIHQVVVQAGSNEPQQMAVDFRRELELVLEGLVHQLGARTPRGAT